MYYILFKLKDKLANLKYESIKNWNEQNKDDYDK